MNTSIILEGEYNLSKIFTSDPIEKPAEWLVNVNSIMNQTIILVFLLFIGFVLFMIIRRNDDVKDTEAAVFAGLIISIGAIPLMLIKVSGVALLPWEYAVVIWVITALAVGLDRSNLRY